MTLRQSYLALSEMVVGEVGCRTLEELRLEVRSSDCPVRLMVPTTKGEQGYFGIGVLSKSQWALSDLCLWQACVAGTGIEQCANDMLAYVELYAAAIRSLKHLAGSPIQSVKFELGTVKWGTDDYWAIDTTIEVEEWDP